MRKRTLLQGVGNYQAMLDKVLEQADSIWLSCEEQQKKIALKREKLDELCNQLNSTLALEINVGWPEIQMMRQTFLEQLNQEKNQIELVIRDETLTLTKLRKQFDGLQVKKQEIKKLIIRKKQQLTNYNVELEEQQLMSLYYQAGSRQDYGNH